MTKNKQNGFSLLEIVIGVGIIAISIFSLMAVSVLSFKVIEENTKNIQAAFLLEEGVEALKVLRDSSWTNNIAPLSGGADYYLDFSNGSWQATSSNIYIDDVFERKFTLENVNRDTNDDIVSSGGTLDPDTKKLSLFVSWYGRNGTTTQSISTYITNLFGN